VRSGGLRSKARWRVSEQDLEWAEVVFLMEREHKATLRLRLSHLAFPHFEVLDVPDDYDHMDVQIQEMLRLTLDPELAMLVAAKVQGA
jgi:predicted protein tyrosine phosphatase